MMTTTGDNGLIKLLCVRMQLLEFPSLHAHILCPSLSFLLSSSFSYVPFIVCVYMIVCFTLDVNCEERRRSSNVQRVYTYKKKEELTRDNREKERKDHLSFLLLSSSSSSSSVYSRNDCILLCRLRIELLKVILYIVQLSHKIEEKNLLGGDIEWIMLGIICSTQKFDISL